MNPYREAADEIERTWHRRSNGIRPRPASIWYGETPRSIGLPKPPVDPQLISQLECAEDNRRRASRRMWGSILAGVAFVALAALIILGIVKFAP